METDITNYLLIAIGIGIIINIILLINKSRNKDSYHLSDRVDFLNKQMTQTLLNVQRNMDDRLKESSQNLQRGNQHIGERLDNAAKAVHAVNEKLAKVEEANKRIYDVGKDISSLQEILKAPKLRGGLGELFLTDLLSQIFPKEHYKLQYRFKDGATVDAIILMKDSMMVSVDSKFPLENFIKMINHEKSDDTNNNALREKKLFVTQVKKHIDDIATKYIKTDEGTFDFALMYIPAENIYYETIIKDDSGLIEYAHSKKVFPVSPNSFYIYLQAIIMGLRGLEIEQETKNIITSIQRMRKEFQKFEDGYRLVGKHLFNANTSFENSDKQLGKFSEKMSVLENTNVKKIK